MTGWPFDPNVPRNQWAMIEAQGFPEPAPGCVYDGSRLDGGIPLGALGTGYFTLEGTGKIGHCSIFNDIVPPRRDFVDWLAVRVGRYVMPLSTAEIAYWGHYPVADLVATFVEQPVSLGLRAFTPFIVGNGADSNIPAALFEVELTNRGDDTLELELSVSPPAPPAGKLEQVTVLGEGLRVDFDGKRLRGTTSVVLAPGAARRLRFVFAWYAPRWREGGSGEPHVHRYGTRYDSAEAVARDALARFDVLLAGVLAWQREVYRAELPMWLRDALVQCFYSMAKNTIWIARTRKDEWWSDDGWLTHSESHTGCPIPETVVCRYTAHFPFLFFFPELEAGTMDGLRHFQISDGEVPFGLGWVPPRGGTPLRDPRYHCQHPLNSGAYAQMVYRLYLRTGDREQLGRFYDSARRAIRYQYSLDDDGDGLVNEQPHTLPGEHYFANQLYDYWPWAGTSAQVAGTWLATLRSGQALAEAMGDAAFAEECREWLRRGRQAYEDKLWTGSYYRLWNDPEHGRQSDISLGNQLMGQWAVKVAGLPDVLPEEHVQAALDTVVRLNMAATAYGLLNATTAEGQRVEPPAPKPPPLDYPRNIFVYESLCAAMEFMYHGRDEAGLEIAQRVYEAMALKSRSPWNQRCLINGESGLPEWGDDYYSNMSIWGLPMALAHEAVGAFVEDGKLVARMLKAAQEKET